MKVLIYERTSTKEQHPELQNKDNINFCSLNNLEIVDIIEEQGSAWKKSSKRLEWEKCIELAKKNKYSIVLWRYDRAFRNREEFYKFMKIMFEVYNVKIYSVKEPSIMALWEMIDKQNISDPIQSELIKGIMKVLWNFLIQSAGEQAEEESKKKSERVKLAVVREEGKKAKSYRGKKWGRKSIPKSAIELVLELNKKGYNIRKIASEVKYNDSSNNQKNISKSVVHKILNENKGIKV